MTAAAATKSDQNAGIAALTAAFGNRVVTSLAVRQQHGNTFTWIANQPPDAVVVLQERDQAGAEGAGRAGDRDGEAAPCRAAHCWPAAAGAEPARASSSSMPCRMPADSTSTSGKESKSALMPNVIELR